MNLKPLLFFALSTLAASVLAQESKPLNVSIRGGIFMPSFSSASDVGKSWFAIGAESRIKNLGVSATNPGQSSYLTISFDSYSKSGYRNIPALVNYVYRQNELYFTAGAGLAFADEPGRRNDGTRGGFQIGGGWDFQQGKTPLFVELKWFGTTKNDHLSGFGAFVGVRL